MILQDRFDEKDYGNAMQPREYVPWMYEQMAQAVVKAWEGRAPSPRCSTQVEETKMGLLLATDGSRDRARIRLFTAKRLYSKAQGRSETAAKPQSAP